MAMGGRRRRGGGELNAWPGYVDALSTLLMVIIFVLLVFVLGQGFLSVALSSRDRALDRLNRQVSELSELLSLERGQAEELRGSLGRLSDDLRAAITARDTALEGLSALREERDRVVAERDAARGERSRLSARLADLELSARDGSARVTDLESRLAEAQARAEAAGGDTARTVRNLTDAQRLLAAERAALEAVRRDLAQSRGEVQSLGGELANQRTALADLERQLQEAAAARDATSQALATSRQQAQTLTSSLAETNAALEASRRNLAEQTTARAAAAQQSAERQRQAEALAADLATTRSALEVARRDLAEQTQARSATMQELAEVRALTERQLEERRREAEALATALANARTALEAARKATQDQTAARSATEQQLAELRTLTASQLEQRQREAEALAAELATARSALEAARQAVAAQTASRTATEQELAEARATAARDLEARRQEAAALAAQLAEARQGLDAARRDLAALREEAARLDQTVTADRATIQARLSDIAGLSEQIRALQALRDQLEAQAQEALDRAGNEARLRQTAEAAQAEAQALLERMTGRASQAEQAAQQAAARAAQADQAREAAGQLAAEAGRRAAEEARRRAAAEAQAGEYGRLSESAQAQVALLTRQLQALRGELSRITAALDLSEDSGRDKDAQITALGQRLNVALAARVEELQQYRSDFFGRLRQVLGNRADVQIVGDRFVFQSEVLFPVGSAELSPAGQQQIRELAGELLKLAQRFPPDLGWLLRVDGHADRSPIRGGGRFATNWELSAARAIAVARLLIDAGLPPNRVAAVAFGDTQPLDDRDTPEAMARNRRIELRLEPAPSGAAQARGNVPAPSSAPTSTPAGPSQDLGRILEQAVPDEACARLAVTGAGAAARITGVARDAVLARLGSALQAAGLAGSANAARGFTGPYCPVIDALRPVARGAAGLGLDLVGSGPVAQGTPLQVSVTMPDWAGQVSLFYLSSSGEAFRLERREGLAAGSRTRFGEPGPGFTGWLVDAPFGTDMVLAVASAQPLFAQPRPQSEPIADFATALGAALAAARRDGVPVAARLLPVETVAR